ncbi:DUF4230 domain-containing protein [Nocardioides marmoraquaticus]
MRKVIGGVLALAVAAMLVVVAVVALRVTGVGLPFGSDEVDRSQPALLTAVRDVSRYDAATGTFQVVVDLEDDTRFVPDFISGRRSLFVASGTVDAYIDLSSLGDGDLSVSEDGRSVSIDLPPAELDQPNLDQSATRLFSQDRGLLDRVGDALSASDQQELYLSAEERLASAAQESDLRERAESNTQKFLEGMLGALEYDDVTVTFDAPRSE